VLPGPGEFNLAIKTDARGDTCVNSMAGSTSSVVVAELMGAGTYEIKPGQQVVFRQGRMQSVDSPLASCGCPPAQEPVLRTSNSPTAVLPEQSAALTLQMENSDGYEPEAKTVGSDSLAQDAQTKPNPNR